MNIITLNNRGIGGILAVLWPYYNVVKANPGTKFDWAYAVNLALAVFLAMPTAIVAPGLILENVPPAVVEFVESPWFILARASSSAPSWIGPQRTASWTAGSPVFEDGASKARPPFPF
jgi:hypothetical protein